VVIDLEILPYFDVVEVTETVADACRDPHDNKFLAVAVAVAGRAAGLITGAKDLLELLNFRQSSIVTPGEFLGEMGAVLFGYGGEVNHGCSRGWNRKVKLVAREHRGSSVQFVTVGLAGLEQPITPR